jgi:hypothetical protein
MQAIMHWHSDKFLARLGPALHQADRGVIVAQVQLVSQRINEERAARLGQQ